MNIGERLTCDVVLLLHMPFSFITPLIQTSRHKIAALIVMLPQLRCQFLANGTGNQVKNCCVYLKKFFFLLLWIYISIAHAPSLSLMGALTSTIFVATRQLRLLRQTRLLSQQEYACCHKSLAQKHVCCNNNKIVATKRIFCRNRSMLVVTKFCHKNIMFVVTKYLS